MDWAVYVCIGGLQDRNQTLKDQKESPDKVGKLE